MNEALTVLRQNPEAALEIIALVIALVIVIVLALTGNLPDVSDTDWDDFDI